MVFNFAHARNPQLSEFKTTKAGLYSHTIPELRLLSPLQLPLPLPRTIGWRAMPSWPMIEYQTETWCLLVTHSSSHVRLALCEYHRPPFGLCIIIIIIKSIDQAIESIAYTHNIASYPVESSCQHSTVSYTCIAANDSVCSLCMCQEIFALK
jgi:hypothetical protein